MGEAKRRQKVAETWDWSQPIDILPQAMASLHARALRVEGMEQAIQELQAALQRHTAEYQREAIAYLRLLGVPTLPDGSQMLPDWEENTLLITPPKTEAPTRQEGTDSVS